MAAWRPIACSKTNHPPHRGGSVVLQQPSRGLMARHGPRIKSGTCLGSRVPSALGPGTRLHLFTGLIAIPRTRPDTPAEIRGPCRKRSRGYVSAPCRRWNVGEFQSFPYDRGPKTEHGVSTGYRPRATGHPITTHHELRTTYPHGGYMGPPLRRDNTPRVTTTGHELQATGFLFLLGPGTPAFVGVSSRYLQRQGR